MQSQTTSNLAIESDQDPLESASPVARLSAEQTDVQFDSDFLDFDTTSDLEPLAEIVGQDRAMSALEMGLGIRQDGYNIFVAGLTGTGKKETIRRSLEKRLVGSEIPNDWVYVHNFENSDEPWAIDLPHGKGRQLRKDMERLVEQLREALPKAFRQQDFTHEKEELNQKYQNHIEEQTKRLRKMADDRGFEMTFTPQGQVSFRPRIKGESTDEPQRLEDIPEEERERFNQGERELTQELNAIMREQRQMMRNLGQEVRDVELRFAREVVAPLIDAVKKSYADHERLSEYFDRVREHVLENLSDFRQRHDAQQVPAQLQGMLEEDSQPRFLEYQVNVLVDNSHAETAPIVVEETPTYRHLFGSIDRSMDRRGRLVTNFMQIKAGSILRANGGYLVFNLEDALTEPFVYKNLKRALKSGCIQLESYNPWVPFSTGGLRPEPITLDTKVIAIGNPILYYLLRFYDDEFGAVFKVKADFGTEMPRGAKEQGQYAQFIAAQVKKEQLKPFTPEAVHEMLRFAARGVADQEKLLTRFSEAADLVREADYVARNQGAGTVDAVHVRQALDDRVYRSDRIAEKIRELIEEGTLLVDTEGHRVGQINGLGVVNLGDYAFGKPSRLTVSVGLGTDGLINIERESRLSGSTHDKGVLILAGFLRNHYGRREPVTLSASICFEQNYGGVDGDSASSAELLALLSHLADVPLRQDIAVTGSVNQWGQIQAIGGVNEKIEGFYDVCRSVGLTGEQGVCIPASNVKNLILRTDVRDAIAGDRFHIYPIGTIDEGLELLTGFKAGTPGVKGSLHDRVAKRLRVMAETLRGFGRDHETRWVPTESGTQRPPRPPRIPGDQP